MQLLAMDAGDIIWRELVETLSGACYTRHRVAAGLDRVFSLAQMANEYRADATTVVNNSC